MELNEAEFTMEYDGEDFDLPIYNNKIILKGCLWKPKTKPKYLVIYVHGLGSYVSANRDVFLLILKDGGAVIGVDHLGHGRSPGLPVVLTVNDIVIEIIEEINYSKKIFKNIPFFLHGHSLGGLSVLKTIFLYPEEIIKNINGVIIESPYISQSPFKKISLLESFFSLICEFFFPNFYFSSGIPCFSEDMPKEFINNTLNCPYNKSFLSPKLINSCFDSITFVRNSLNNWPKNLRAFFVAGGQDDLVDTKDSLIWFNELILNVQDNLIIQKIYPFGPHVLSKSNYRFEFLNNFFLFINSF